MDETKGLVTYYYVDTEYNEEKVRMLYRDLVSYAQICNLEYQTAVTADDFDFLIQMRDQAAPDKACTIVFRHPTENHIKVNQGITNWLTEEEKNTFFEISELEEPLHEIKDALFEKSAVKNMRHDTKMLIKVRFGRYAQKKWN